MPDRPSHPTRSWRGLRLSQLFALIILPLAVLALTFALGGATLHQRAMRRMVGERDGLAVRAAANALNVEVDHRLAEVRSLGLLAETSPDSYQAIFDATGYLRTDFDLGLAFASSGGQLLATSGDPSTWEALLTPEIPNPQTGQVSLRFLGNEPVVLLASPSANDSLLALGAFSVENLGTQILSPVLPADSQARVFLVSRDHRLIFDSNHGLLSSSTVEHAGVSEALGGASGTLYTNDAGQEHVVAYGPVTATGWALVMEENWQTVVTPLSRTSEIAPLALIPVLLIALAGIWFGVRQIVRPLQALETKADSLAGGDFGAIKEPVGGISEIRHLQTELERMAGKVQVAQESLHDYIGAITGAQEEERRRLARDLHDDTLQALIALKQRIQLAEQGKQDQSAADALKELEVLAEGTIRDLHRVTRDLRPVYLEDLGLVIALEMLAHETSEAAGIPVRFQHAGAERRLSPQAELALYRIAQEALNNVARHAQAGSAALSINFGDGRVKMDASDDGIGFHVPTNPSEFAAGGHFGLLGMNERADLIGARLEIHSSPGKGTHVRIELPIEETGGKDRTAR